MLGPWPTLTHRHLLTSQQAHAPLTRIAGRALEPPGVVSHPLRSAGLTLARPVAHPDSPSPFYQSTGPCALDSDSGLSPRATNPTLYHVPSGQRPKSPNADGPDSQSAQNRCPATQPSCPCTRSRTCTRICTRIRRPATAHRVPGRQNPGQPCPTASLPPPSPTVGCYPMWYSPTTRPSAAPARGPDHFAPPTRLPAARAPPFGPCPPSSARALPPAQLGCIPRTARFCQPVSARPNRTRARLGSLGPYQAAPTAAGPPLTAQTNMHGRRHTCTRARQHNRAAPAPALAPGRLLSRPGSTRAARVQCPAHRPATRPALLCSPHHVLSLRLGPTALPRLGYAGTACLFDHYF